MENQCLMGSNDSLTRASSRPETLTSITPRLRASLIKAAMQTAFHFHHDFLELPAQNHDFDSLVSEYENDFNSALTHGLFKTGGIGEKDHLNLWCLGRVFKPELYIESGVYIGSSLHAFITSPGLKETIAIDPDMSKLRIPVSEIPGAVLVDDRDFSQLRLESKPNRVLAYFDDHINTADRIIQSYNKGITHLLFDDSGGLEGICQRLYPAIPTIPLIMNVDLLTPGDEIGWTYTGPRGNNLFSAIRNTFSTGTNHGQTRITLNITNDFIAKCKQAKFHIRKVGKIPHLGDYIPQMQPKKTNDMSKFMVILNHD